jgi:hypothetical protein
MRRALIGLIVILSASSAATAAPKPTVYVVLWFDTEDYMLPASDDAALRVADWLHKEGIRATFKVVGEKARTLEKRGRTDVIESLKKHEIGYHSNYHSTQPSPAMYLSALGWDEGVAEFDRRERPGFDDVTRIFGKAPTCYGQPGSSWGPQSFGAMRKWNMPIYLDAGRHVSLNGRPHYYGGIFTLYQLTHTLRTSLGGEKDLKPAEDKFLDARTQLLADGGGVVSIFYHPCEFVHKQFWDGVNFGKGANPPREKWQIPPQKSETESKVAYDTFEAYIRFIKRFNEVKFVTASEALGIYRDQASGREFSVDEIKAIAAQVGTDVAFQTQEDIALAPSEILFLLNNFLVEQKPIKLIPTPFGPSNPPLSQSQAVTTDAGQFTRTAADVAGYMRKHGKVPSTVWLGSAEVSPEAYLSALARIVAEGKPVPEKIDVVPAKLTAAKYVAEDDPRLWGWVIFPPNFRAPAMMELAKRQAWTLKPALLHAPKP